MANSQIRKGVATFDQANSTPFKFYNNDFQFRQDAVKVASFCAQRLGYPSMDVEMDAEQLWETTLNPETRILKQVEIEDARMATEVTSMLMGSDVPPRRAFIHAHANEAEIDA